MKRFVFLKNKTISSIYNSRINYAGLYRINYFQTALFVCLSLSLNSCIKLEEEIPWDLKNHPPMLVVDGAVTNELKNQGIRLTLSNNYFSSDDPEVVHGALVYITEGNNTYTFTESTDSTGWYYSNEPFAGLPGKTYNLLINLKEEVNGQKEYTSFSTMPESLDIDSIQCTIYALPKIVAEETGKTKDTTILVVLYFGNEPKTPGNYYCAKIFRNGMPLFSSVKSYPFSDDKERNGKYTNYMAVIQNVAANDTISFNLFSIDKAYYNYVDAISKIDQTGNIYSPQGPPANAQGNVTGALGFFIATYISTGTSLALDMR
jgi:hypothetical protein